MLLAKKDYKVKIAKPKNLFWINIVAIGLLLVDRLVKKYFIENPSNSFGGDFFYGVLKFNFAENYGIAFGIGLNNIIILILIFIALIIIIHALLKAYLEKDLILITSLTLIFAGAISNLIDRFTYGFVIDYIDLKYFTVFNIADAMITAGVIILLFSLIINRKVDKKEEVM